MRGRLLQGLLLASMGLVSAWAGTDTFEFAYAQGGYSGVAPGSNSVPDGIAAAPGAGALVTWPGFQMLPNGGSRVFIQTSVEVKPDLRREGNTLYVTLSSFALPKGNARLPLDTSFFNTPVRSVRAKAKKDAVVVEVELRANVSPSMRNERAATGYYFVYLDFPAGNYQR
jgi:hypothetical protein